MTAALAIYLATAPLGRTLPDSPVPTVTATSQPVKPAAQRQPFYKRSETWIVVGETAALILDGVTTRQVTNRGSEEADPLTRPLIGTRPNTARMIAWGSVEVGAAWWLARRHPRARLAQVGFAAAHLAGGIHNLTLPVRRNRTYVFP